MFQFYLPSQDAERLKRETNEEVQKSILINFTRNNNLPVQNRTHNGGEYLLSNTKCLVIRTDKVGI